MLKGWPSTSEAITAPALSLSADGDISLGLTPVHVAATFGQTQARGPARAAAGKSLRRQTGLTVAAGAGLSEVPGLRPELQARRRGHSPGSGPGCRAVRDGAKLRKPALLFVLSPFSAQNQAAWLEKNGAVRGVS